MELFEIGACIVQFRGVEGNVFDLDETGFCLFNSMKNIQAEELEAYQTGHNIRFRVGYYHGIIFLFYKVGGLPWNEVPFYINLSPAPESLKRPQGACYGITLFLLEGITGEIKSMRLVSLPQRESKLLYDLIQEQRETVHRTREEHIAEYWAVCNSYSTGQLLKLCAR